MVANIGSVFSAFICNGKSSSNKAKFEIVNLRNCVKYLASDGLPNNEKIRICNVVSKHLEKATNSAFYKAFLTFAIPKLLTVLESSRAEFIFDLGTEELRNLILNIMDHLPVHMLEPFVEILLLRLQSLLPHDNEENVLISLRIIIKLQNEFRPSLNYQAKLLEFMESMYKVMLTKVHKIFVPRITNIIEIEDTQQLIYENFTRRTVRVLDGDAQMARTVHLVPKGVFSLKVLQELALVINSLDEKYGYCIKSYIGFIMDIIVLEPSAEERQNPAFCKDNFEAFIAVQVKSISLIARVANRHHIFLKEYHTVALIEGLLNLLILCPPGLVSLRRCLLAASKEIFAGELRQIFAPFMGGLLDKPVLLGRGRTSQLSLLAPVHTLMVDMIFRMGLKMDSPGLTKAVYVLSKGLLDINLPKTLQKRCCQLLPVLSAYLTSNSSNQIGATESQRITLIITDTFLTKLKMISKHDVPALSEKTKMTGFRSVEQYGVTLDLVKELILGLRIVSQMRIASTIHATGELFGQVCLAPHEAELYAGLVKWALKVFDLFQVKVNLPVSEEQQIIWNRKKYTILQQFGLIYSTMATQSLQELLTKTFTYLVSGISRNPHIKFVLLQLLTNKRTNPISVNILIKYLRSHMINMGSSPITGSCYLKLFKLLFQCAVLYPKECNIIIKPYLKSVVVKCLKLFTCSSYPLYYLKLLITIIRRVGHENHEGLQKVIQTILPNILQFLTFQLHNNQLNTDINCLITELSLIIAIKLNCFKPYLSIITSAIISGLNGSEKLISLALETLELYLNAVEYEEFSKHLQTVKTALFHPLWKLLQGRGLNSQIAFSILGKFGGENRDVLSKGPSSLAHETNFNPTSFIIGFKKYERPVHIPLKEILETANLVLRQKNLSTFYLEQAWNVINSYLAASIALGDDQSGLIKLFSDPRLQDLEKIEKANPILYRTTFTSARKNHQMALIGMFIAATVDELHELVRPQLVSVVRHHTLAAATQQIDNCRTPNSIQALSMDGLVLVDALAFILGQGDDSLYKLGCATLMVIFDTVLTLLKDKELIYHLPFIKYLWATLGALCYEPCSASKAGGCIAIGFMLRQFSREWVADHVDFVSEPLFHVLVDLTGQVCYGVQNAAMAGLELVLDILTISGTCDHKTDDELTKALDYFTLETVSRTVNSDVLSRKHSILLLRLLAKKRRRNLPSVINPFKAVIGVVIPCVPDFKELSDNVKIGILEGNLLYASLYRRIFPVDMGSRKQIDFLADLSLLCNSSEKELKKYDCYTNNQDIALLRKYALRLLATYYRLPVVRDSIFCILYKTMDEPNVELQQTAFECLRKQIAAYSYNMELAKNAVKPLLDTLSNVSSLTIRGLTTMSFSAELFPEIFTELFFKAICNRLNQLMVNESHHGPHIHDYLTPTIEDDKMQKISKALTILYKASKSSPRFVADVCMCTFKAKKIMFMEIERPLTTNFWKYLSSHVSHTLHFLMSDIMLVKPQCNHLLKLLLKQQSLGRPFRNYIKAKMVHRLLEMLAVDPKANCRLPRSEVHFQAIRIISYLVGFDDGWLATQPILVKSLKGIWRDPLYLEQHRTVSSLLHSHWEEPNLLVKLLLNYFCSNKSKHIKLLFQSLKLTCFPHVRSIEFLYDFLSQTVKSSSVCWRRRAFYKFVDLLSSNDIMQEIKSKIVDLILIPSFNICFVQGETHNLIAGHMMPEYGNLNHIVAVFIDCLSNCHIPEADQLHGSLLRLGCLVVTKAKYCIEDHSSENYNEWLEGLRSYVLLCLGNTSVDPSVRPLGHLLLSLLIANFRTGESFAKELFYSLLTTNTFETPILVRRTCEVLLMIVPIHLIADWTEKILLQSSPNIQVLMPVLQFIIHQKEAFFPFRHLLSRPVVTCIQHLSSGPETRFVHKKCRILLAKTVTNWNDRRRIKHAEEDLQATGVEERLIEKSIFEMVIRFLIRCICDRSAYMAGHLASNDIMLLSHSCVDLLKAILNQAQSRSVDIRLGVFIKSFPKMAPTKIGAPSQCMILELLIRFVTMVRPQWIIKYLRNMQYYVATCLQSPNISIMKRVYNLARQFSIRSPDQNFSVLNESFFCTAHEVVDGFGGLVESNPLELFNTLRFVKEVSTIKRSLHNLSIEKILSILSEAKTIHLDRHVPETLYVTSELIIYCLEILVAEVEANQSTASENFLFTVLEELVLHTQSRALLEYVLKLLAEKLIFKMDDLLDSQIKLLLKLRRTLNTIFSEDEGFQKEFYTVVLRIASTWKISNSDLRRDMQGLFWEGMRSSRHLVRKKFSVALEPVVNQYLFDRLAFIVTIPIWNSTQHYWVTPWIELLLKRTANEQIPLNVSFESVVAEVTSALNPTFTNISENGDKSVLEMVERHFRFLKLRNNRSVNNILFGICQLCYIDKLLSKQVWLQLFPGIWSIFDQVEQSKLNKMMLKFLGKQISLCEDQCHPSTLATFIRATYRIQPLINKESAIWKKLGKMQCMWHQFAINAENLCNEANDETATTSTDKTWKIQKITDGKQIHVLNEIYALLFEKDFWAATWVRLATHHNTTVAVSLEQHGLFDQAAKEYLHALQTLERPAHKELWLWSEHAVHCGREAGDWGVIKNVSLRKPCSPYILLGALLRSQDLWPTLRSILNDIKLNCASTTDWQPVFFENLVSIGETEEGANWMSVVKNSNECIERCLAQWRSLPYVVGRPHLQLLQVAQQVVELLEGFQISKTLNDNTLIRQRDSILKTWNVRSPIITDDLGLWDDVLTWRRRQFELLARRAKTSTNRDSYQWAVNGVARTTAILGNILRKSGSEANALRLLGCNTLVESMPVDVGYEIIKCYIKMEHFSSGIQFIESINTKKLKHRELSEIFAITGHLHQCSQKLIDAHDAFADALTCTEHSSRAWANYGYYLDRLFLAYPNERQLAVDAIHCFLKAFNIGGESKSRELIPRILAFEFYDNGKGAFKNALKSYMKNTPPNVWLPWLPQIVRKLKKMHDNVFSDLLKHIGQKLPYAVYVSVNTLYTANQDGNLEIASKCEFIMKALSRSHPSVVIDLTYMITLLKDSFQYSPLNPILQQFRKCLKECYNVAFITRKSVINIRLPLKIRQIWRKMNSGDIANIDIPSAGTIKDTAKRRWDKDFCRRNVRFLHRFIPELGQRISNLEQYLSSLPSDFSPSRLAGYKTCGYDMPLPAELLQPKYEHHYDKFERFLPRADMVVKCGTHMWRIYIRANNGLVYPYLVAPNYEPKDSQGEECVQQVFGMLNYYLRQQPVSS